MHEATCKAIDVLMTAFKDYKQRKREVCSSIAFTERYSKPGLQLMGYTEHRRKVAGKMRSTCQLVRHGTTTSLSTMGSFRSPSHPLYSQFWGPRPTISAAIQRAK
eukprot:6211876-Pleurochrysis_carterae.AAC.4